MVSGQVPGKVSGQGPGKVRSQVPTNASRQVSGKMSWPVQVQVMSGVHQPAGASGQLPAVIWTWNCEQLNQQW